jgi:hypothetical protein
MSRHYKFRASEDDRDRGGHVSPSSLPLGPHATRFRRDERGAALEVAPVEISDNTNSGRANMAGTAAAMLTHGQSHSGLKPHASAATNAAQF